MKRAMLAAGIAIAAVAPAFGQSAPITAQTLIDRAQIEDLLTRYYYNLGRGAAGSFGQFYTDDAEFVLGANTYKGKEGIEGAYAAARRPQPAPADGKPAEPSRQNSYAFNVLLTNALINVTGTTATAQVIFTETIVPKAGDKPQLLAQGREYDRLVKVGGQWKFKRRQIAGDTKPPADWPQ